jgi:hypothetical protein
MTCLWTFEDKKTLTKKKIWGRQRPKLTFFETSGCQKLPRIGWTFKGSIEQDNSNSFNSLNSFSLQWFCWLFIEFICLSQQSLVFWIKLSGLSGQFTLCLLRYAAKYRPSSPRTNLIKKKRRKVKQFNVKLIGLWTFVSCVFRFFNLLVWRTSTYEDHTTNLHHQLISLTSSTSSNNWVLQFWFIY